MSYYTSVIIIVLLALWVLSVLISENDQIPLRKKRIFFVTIILIGLSAIAECAGVNISGNPEIPSWVLAAVKAADYTLTPMTGGALIALMKRRDSRRRYIQWLFIGNAVLQVISAFEGWMVVIDENNNYTHGRLYPVYMIIYCIVILTLIVRLISYGNTYRKQYRMSLYSTMILIFIGIGIQEILGSEYRVAYIALAFGAAYLFIHDSEFSQLQMEDQITLQRVIISIDALTGVFSRFAYVDAINEYADKVPEDFALFLIDIDRLKSVNDSLGHEAGDELIRGAAACIESTLGKAGRTFRIGGDEFVVFANMSAEQADAALADLEKATQAWSGERVKALSVSVGYALAKDHKGCSVEELTKAADEAMYERKKAFYEKSGADRRR